MIQPKGKKLPALASLAKDLGEIPGLSLTDILAAAERADTRAKAEKKAKNAAKNTSNILHRREYKRMQKHLSAYEASKKVFSELRLGEWKATKLILKVHQNTCLECGNIATIPEAKDPVMLQYSRQTKKGLEHWIKPAPPVVRPNLERSLDITYSTSVLCGQCFNSTEPGGCYPRTVPKLSLGSLNFALEEHF